MKEIQTITVCHECKKIFSGTATEFKCPNCNSNKLTLLSMIGVYEAIKESERGEGCPNMFDGFCGLVGKDILEE